MFKGCIVALVTPFKNYEVDYKKLEELVGFHLANETDAIVAVGTTGESPTLNDEERFEVTKCIVKTVAGKIPVIAGAGTSCTHKSIEHAKAAKEAGADALLVVTPYYNKPSQQGLYLHFEAIANAVNLPIIMYNVPSRTGVNLASETVAKLSKIKNIVAIKEASGNIEQVNQIRNMCDITILSGEDALTYSIMCLGGTGVIAVSANIIPRELSKMCRLANNGELKEAQQLHLKYYNLFKAMFIETNPVPVKTALRFMGMLNGELRLPLCPMSPENEGKLKEILRCYKFI